jgi:uncharacterized protein YabN with tetrapyrrole methylase and pyrophosphatase domain
VGLGIEFLSHVSTQTKACIEKSAKVLYLVNEPLTEQWLKNLNHSSESLQNIYSSHERRSDSYQAIADYIVKSVEAFKQVCVVMYGHPTVFAKPAMDAAIKAKQLNITVRILPAISAEDCLFSDCMIDPGEYGCQSFEATDFLIHKRIYDCNSHLLLWQIGMIGNVSHQLVINNEKLLGILVEYLAKTYDLEHKIIIYEAALYPTFQPRIEEIMLKQLPKSILTKISTLYIPPKGKSVCDPEMLNKLGVSLESLKQ